MLKDDAMSANDMASVETALQKFQRQENQAQMSDARVIGMGARNFLFFFCFGSFLTAGSYRNYVRSVGLRDI